MPVTEAANKSSWLSATESSFAFIHLLLATLVFAAMQAFSSCSKGRLLSIVALGLLAAEAPLMQSTGSRLPGLQRLRLLGSRVKLSSGGARAWLLHGTRDLPGSGQNLSSAFAGGFFTI